MRVKDVIRELGADVARAHTIAIYELYNRLTVYKPSKDLSLEQWVAQLNTEERKKFREAA